MTRYEAMTMMESALRRLAENNVDINDVRHLDMYRDYVRLSREGHKKMYIEHYLCEQYGVGRATIYRVADRMGKELT